MPLFSNRVRNSRNTLARRAARPVEALETRRLLAVTVVQAPPAVTGTAESTSTIDLSQYLNDTAVNTQVRFTTELGNVALELFDQEKPLSVANFLNYVRQGRYDTTIIHRKTDVISAGIAVVQGGGYAPPTFAHIPTDLTPGQGITNEAPLDPILSNTRGTIAMARTMEANSATSEWFINSVDNTSLDPASQPPGYAVFGQVVNNTLTTVDAIQALPAFSFGDPQSSPFTTVPLRNYTQQDYDANTSPTANNFVSITAETLPELTFQVSSSNPAVVTPTVSGNKLSLQYGAAPTPGAPNSAEVTVTATDTNGQSVTQTFTASLGLDVVLGTGGSQSVTFTDADGTVGTITYKGPGAAKVTLNGPSLTAATVKTKTTVTGAAAVNLITVTGASAATAITVAGKGGNGVLDIAGLTADSALKSISAKPTNLTGPLSVAGSVGKLDLGTVTNTTLTLGGAATDKPGAVTLGAVTGSSITSAAPLKSITATSFAAGESGRATISAPALQSLTAKGDMAQNVSVAGPIQKVSVSGNASTTIQADSIGSVAVKGTLSDSSIVSTRAFSASEKPIGKVTISGAATNSIIRAAGNITSVTAASFASTTIYAGVADSVNAVTLPAQASDFASAASIGSVTSKSTSADANIAASQLGKLNLGTVTTANNGTPFGVAADKITSVTATIGGTKANLKKLDNPQDATDQTATLTLGDFKIILV
jgi:peptidyl-prolyl cis-trans isomerase A (cyclophilin A)